MKYLGLIIATLLLLLTCNISRSAENPDNTRKSRKASRIHARAVTIDSHNDTPMWFTDSNYNFAADHRNLRPRNRVDLPGMNSGGLDAAFFAVFVGQGERTEAGNIKAHHDAIRTFNAIHRQLELHHNDIEKAGSVSDLKRVLKTGKKAMFIGLENGYPIGKELKNVEKFYNLGARYITLCHSKNNDICDSANDTTEHNGVSEFGKTVIAEMNRLGMMVDVSHVSDNSFYDAIQLSKTPVIASHSCARALCNNPRNLSDDMLKALAENDGVIQMCILSSYVKTPAPNPERDSAQAALRVKYRGFKDLNEAEWAKARDEWYAIDDIFPQELATVADVVDHIDHIVKIAGIKHVGIGTDFDGGGAVKGCEYVSEMESITQELLRRGYSARETKLIWGKNLLRVMKKTEKYAAKNMQNI